MIHRRQRDELALALRRFLSGRIILREFWRLPPFGWMSDRAVAEILDDFEDWAGDLPVGTRAGECVTPRVREALVRAIVFLYSDVEYRWGIRDHLPRPFCRVGGEPEVWPFYERSQLDEARKRPRLLRG